MLEQIDSFNDSIREYDEMVNHLALTKYPETALMEQISGVGTLTALTFRLTVGDGSRFGSSRWLISSSW